MHLDTYHTQRKAARHARLKARLAALSRTTLIIVNAVALTAMVTYGLTVRGAQASVDTATLHAMMDSAAAQPYNLLMPPEVK